MERLKKILPNALSGSRLLISMVFPFSAEWLRLWLVLVAAASDLLDGWLARRWNTGSWQGGLIDAIADKVFVLTVLLVFVSTDRFSPVWIPAVIFRDLIVLATACYAMARSRWDAFRRMEARITGKLATGGQFLLFVVVLALPELTIHALVFATLCSVSAGLDYGWLFIRELVADSGERRRNCRK